MSQLLKDIAEKELSRAEIPDDGTKKKGVALVGFPSSGKSVFASVFLYYLRETASHQSTENSSLSISQEDGFDLVGRQMEFLVNQRTFPPKDLPGTVNRVEVTISKKNRFSEKTVSLQFNDMQGEIFELMLKQKITDPKAYLLNYRVPSGGGHGPGASVVTAKAYAVAIDCGQYNSWQTAQFQYAELLKMIKSIKGSKSFSVPLCVLFTKKDLLPDESLDGRQLLAKLPIVREYMEHNFDLKKTALCVVNIGVERDERTGLPRTNAKGGHIVKSPLTMSSTEMQDFLNWMMRWF